MAKRNTSKKTPSTALVVAETAAPIEATLDVVTVQTPEVDEHNDEMMQFQTPEVDERPEDPSNDEIETISAEEIATLEHLETVAEVIEEQPTETVVIDETSTEAPEHVFNEAEAHAALGAVDFAPIARTTWGETEENFDAEVDPEAEKSSDDFMAQLSAIDKDLAIQKAIVIGKVLDEREAFEMKKNPENASIKRTINSARKALTLSATPARVLIATNVSEEFVNRKLHEGSLYNVCAIGKFADMVMAAGEGVVRNAINIACMKSLFACRKAGIAFTMGVAKACASNKVLIDISIRKHLVRHTVSSSTAPTQASSTMQALVTLGVVTAQGSTRNPTYTLTDTPLTKRLEEVFARVA